MKIGSLFSGAGSLDMAVEQIFGGNTIWHVENDPAASKVLRHRWPTVPNYGDITTINWAQVHPVDVLCGGWPCQPFSQAGKRLGAEDERALWPHVAGAVRLLRPRWVVLENVSAVLTAGEFQRVASALAQAGYEFCWVCVRASDVGAPHRRERVFVLAHTGGEGLQGSWPRRHEPQQPEHVGHRRSAAHASGDGRHQRRLQPEGCGRGSDAAVGGDGPVNLLPTPDASDGDGGKSPTTSGGTRSSGQKRSIPLTDMPHFVAQWGKYGPAIRRWEALTRPAPSPVEPNRNGNPRLNPAFSEWMMGWPDGWVTDLPISRSDQLKIIGNGVVPQQACAALQYLLAHTPAAVGA